MSNIIKSMAKILDGGDGGATPTDVMNAAKKPKAPRKWGWEPREGRDSPEMKTSVARVLPTPRADQFVARAVLIAVGRVGGFELPPAVWNRNETLQTEFEKARRGVLDNTPQAASERFRTQEMERAKAIAEGVAVAENTWTLDELRAEAAQVMASYKAREKAISAESFAVLRPFFAEYASCASRLADEIEAAEAQAAACLSIPYQASPTVLTVRRCAAQVTAMENKFVPGTSPEAIAKFLPAPTDKDNH